eukprot:Em0001g2416a
MENEELDLAEIARTIRGHHAPFKCPACLKTYRSLTGIMYHLGQIGPPTKVPRCRSRRGEGGASVGGTPHGTPGSPGGIVRRRVRRDLTWAESQRMVEVEFNNEYYRIEIDHDLDAVFASDDEDEETHGGEETAGKEPAETTGATAAASTQDPVDPNAPSSSQRSTGSRTPQRRAKCETPKSASKSATKNKGKRRSKKNTSKDPSAASSSESALSRLVADFTVLDNLEYPDAPSRDPAYYRFVEQSAEDLDDMVEYDMDEEDYQWLTLVNEDRKSQGLTAVPQEAFEILMDRLEKECFFEVRSVGEDGRGAGNPYNIDENAVCCICNDGECHNTNAILFCDMCNLAVHQECYGVPYIPEGQWLCRRCLQSPSRAVDCVLCPSKGGAFKQTVEGRWAHVVCALWIPEVQFANTVFLEPIDGIREIPSARWKLTCYLCRKRGGACIQCAKANCYVAFHVTCAQQAGLHMKIEVPSRGGAEIKKLAYCDGHTPLSVKKKKMAAATAKGKEGLAEEEGKVEGEEGDTSADREKKGVEVGDEEEESNGGENEEREEEEEEEEEEGRKSREPGEEEEEDCTLEDGASNRCGSVDAGMGKKLGKRDSTEAHKILEDRRSSMMQPVVNIPYVPQHRLDRIIGRVSLHKKSQFIPKLVNYWKLKRQSRNGVPLLRRLQASNNHSHRANTTNVAEEREVLVEQLEVWRTLRQDLERVRLLMELVRKRERLKQEQMKMCQHVQELQLCPLNVVLRRILDRLTRKDPANIFAQPVSVEDVPDYLQVIKFPMDFGTMRKKVDSHEYLSLDEFEHDFNLVWKNATVYNEKETIYYRAAARIRDAGVKILTAAREQLKGAGVNEGTGVHEPEVLEPEPLPSSGVVTTMGTLDELPDVFDANEEEGGGTGDHALSRGRLESTTLEEQMQFLEEKLSLLRAQKSGGRKAREKTLRKELNNLRRQLRAEHKAKNPPNSDSDTCPSPPRRSAPNLAPRNAEGLASHMIQGSLRLTPSRQQILCCSGISLEERVAASALSSMMQNGSVSEPKEEHLAPPPPPPEQPASPPPSQQPTASLTNGVLLDATFSSDRPSGDEGEEGDEEGGPSPVPVGREGSGGRGSQQKGRSSRKASRVVQSHHPRRTTNRSSVLLKTEQQQQQQHGGVATTTSTPVATILKKVDTISPRPHPSLRKRAGSSSSLYDDLMSSTSPSSDVHVSGGVVGSHPHHQRCRVTSSSVPSASSVEDLTVKVPIVKGGGGSRKRRRYSSDGEEGLRKAGRVEIEVVPRLLPPPPGTPNRTSNGGAGVVVMQNGGYQIRPLDLVWAKCRGYPPYPALVIDPNDLPEKGLNINGECIQPPSEEVLELKEKTPGVVYLVRFFDGRRTWQWLPPDKIEPLGANGEYDQLKIASSGASKRSVQQAYVRAKQYLRKVGDATEEVKTSHRET